jgi:hypothetical protein
MGSLINSTYIQMMPRQYERDMVLTCVGHLYSVVHVATHSAE